MSCVAITKSSHHWSSYILAIMWLVFVLQDVVKKGLATIADEVNQLAQRARDNNLNQEDWGIDWNLCAEVLPSIFFSNNWSYALQGGTFTVSNLGDPFGIKQFCGIVNPLHSDILAIGWDNMFSEFLYWSYPIPLVYCLVVVLKKRFNKHYRCI